MEVGQFLVLPTYLFSGLPFKSTWTTRSVTSAYEDWLNQSKGFGLNYDKIFASVDLTKKTQRKSRKMLKVSCDLSSVKEHNIWHQPEKLKLNAIIDYASNR